MKMERLQLFLDILKRKKTRRQIINAGLFKLDPRNFPQKPINLPIAGQIEITNRCNLSCRMCYRNSTTVGDMSLNDFKKIVDDLPGLLYVAPTGFGEPLLHDDLFDMIDYARQKNMYVEIATNATLLDGDISKRILSSGLYRLHISIDGATAKTYEYIRRGADFHKVTQNILRFMKMKNKNRNNPHVVMRVVAMKENLHEIPDFVILAHNLGIKHVWFQHLQLGKHGLSQEEHSLQLMKEGGHTGKIEEVFLEARRRAKRLGILLELPQERGLGLRCRQPWFLTFVNRQGFVTPCCVIHDIHMGNALEQPFKAIWRGERFRDWRRRMNSPNPPKQCVDCCNF